MLWLTTAKNRYNVFCSQADNHVNCIHFYNVKQTMLREEVENYLLI